MENILMSKTGEMSLAERMVQKHGATSCDCEMIPPDMHPCPNCSANDAIKAAVTEALEEAAKVAENYTIGTEAGQSGKAYNLACADVAAAIRRLMEPK